VGEWPIGPIVGSGESGPEASWSAVGEFEFPANPQEVGSTTPVEEWPEREKAVAADSKEGKSSTAKLPMLQRDRTRRNLSTEGLIARVTKIPWPRG